MIKGTIKEDKSGVINYLLATINRIEACVSTGPDGGGNTHVTLPFHSSFMFLMIAPHSPFWNQKVIIFIIAFVKSIFFKYF